MKHPNRIVTGKRKTLCQAVNGCPSHRVFLLDIPDKRKCLAARKSAHIMWLTFLPVRTDRSHDIMLD